MEKIKGVGMSVYGSIINCMTKKFETEKAKKDDLCKQKNNTIHSIVINGSEDSSISDNYGTHGICKACVYIVQATFSVDVCVPSLASKDVAAALVCAATKHSTKIRVAIHKSSNFCHLPLLSQHGIEVKVISSELLEHDFILIDALNEENALAVIGSIDYDIHRFNSNKNHQILTCEPCVIRSLKDEFDRVWNSVSIIHT